MQVSDLHELDQIRRVEQEKDLPKDRIQSLANVVSKTFTKCKLKLNSYYRPVYILAKYCSNCMIKVKVQENDV